ncbi:MAG: flagellin [Phenylobacterium sp.]|uniref:flagellin n=1 Tax=Phenylobacterium sp. TaxID=1871053 RepID=UPI00391CD3B1
MTRVSTVANYSVVLANLLAAQKRQLDAGTMVATQKKGSDLKAFSRNAEMLTAMRSVETRLSGFLEQNKLIADKLTTQDFALNQISDAAAATKTALEEALATGRTDTLMQEVEALFRNAVSGMNARYGGKYLFAGGKIDTLPVTAESLAQLTAPPAVIADFFQNDAFLAEHKVDDGTLVKAGILANDIGTQLLTAYQTIQAFQEGPDGPFGGTLTDAQRDFIQGELETWSKLHSDMVDKTARNGMVQARVESVRTDLIARRDSLIGMISDITDADMAEAATFLEQATLSVQASTQVFLSLKESSLLNFLK